jgi:hypothetical protein
VSLPFGQAVKNFALDRNHPQPASTGFARNADERIALASARNQNLLDITAAGVKHFQHRVDAEDKIFALSHRVNYSQAGFYKARSTR